MGERFEDGFAGCVAVVTGGGTGMGRELVRQLTADGCDVATCDVIAENLDETVAICAADGNAGEILPFIADVSIESQVLAFRDRVAAWRPHMARLLKDDADGTARRLDELARDTHNARVFSLAENVANKHSKKLSASSQQLLRELREFGAQYCANGASVGLARITANPRSRLPLEG